ncbi:MAG: bifunctional riboflavin kinase/FAD synthetase [Candidatus Brocadiia bacterium]|nr:MAG: bifunctional riboflavin kinase/FAD synthetase [Candidatus Brocadiia bacterium]
MKIIEEMSELKQFGRDNKGPVVTIGNFDGVHLGHQEILKTAREIADQRRAMLIVMTFEPHPVAVLYPDVNLGILTPLKAKAKLFEKFGVDSMFILKTMPEILHLSPAAFVDRLLKNATNLSVAVEGDNFSFGYGRAGNVHTLQSLGASTGFEVAIVEAKQVKLSIGQAVKVSSTLIRNLLTESKVVDASAAMGRPYRLAGKIISGRGKGRKLGYPTLNIEQSDQIIPAEGVYAGYVEIGNSFETVFSENRRIPAAVSIGHTTTFGPYNPMLIEAHLLADKAAEIKGSWMAIDFIEHIRPQHKFDKPQHLVEQIKKDCEVIMEILAAQP